MTSAELCRERGWGPGTRIVRDFGSGPQVMEITAVGEQHVLAKHVSLNRESRSWLGEDMLSLLSLEWREVSDDRA